MNYVYLSPHFPPNFYHFVVGLRDVGATVLGIGDCHFSELRPELQKALTDYQQVDMHDYKALVKACGQFTAKYGKLDAIDSQSEYWLETEAKLRTDFNMAGIKSDTIDDMKCKSLMKKKFIDAGIPVARGEVIDNLADAVKFVEKVKLPVVAKPDNGVGASKTYKITTKAELEAFFDEPRDIPYIFEEFIAGDVLTFDGITDADGNLVFYASHIYNQGIMETVNTSDHVYYYSARTIAKDLEEAGRKTLKAYDIRSRFFHLEFFRTFKDKKIVALEVNMRPPGGLTTDMFNYANNINIYKEWANVVVNNKFTATYDRPYHVCYISRKFNKHYVHAHDEVLATLGENIAHWEIMPAAFRDAIGDYAYLLRSPDEAKIKEMAAYIHDQVGHAQAAPAAVGA
ncbi:MAG: ATP-grasp domain-containing protein [Candidatus Sericytochromatia bacterium]|nr:ATP-grasp domain-containing protein [Candidatus Sericytochromatia bacterium]